MKIQYASYQDTIDFLQKSMSEHPHLIRLQSIGETWEGRPIMLVTVSLDVTYADDKPALLYTGSIHAREWIGNELAIKFIQYVIDNYRFNPKLQTALTRNTLYMVPCLNPDGFEYSRNHFSFWRKNRRNNGDGTFGVDLNRNFDAKFMRNQNTQSNTYGGPHAFSEPETSAIRDFVESHENIRIALDYHSQGNVFFPAHKFNHEVEIEGTDLNVLCANMNNEIKKVTGRQYGIHRGKPPAQLIQGSGREYYYRRGIIATVVEVGTRNIPDYMKNMAQSVAENIPAVAYALSEAINYSPLAPSRVAEFTIKNVGRDTVELEWRYQERDDIYFEVYRSEHNKSPCTEENLVAITKSQSFLDTQLKSGHFYFYNIRAVDKVTKIKSPFSPELRLKTMLADNECGRTLFPAREQVGYLSQHYLNKNKEHFGYNSMFIGVDKKRGISIGVVAFDLSTIPDGSHVATAQLFLYPMNRVAAKIEKYGEWSISILDGNLVDDIYDFATIHEAKPLHTLGQTIESDKMTQGIWLRWSFNGVERSLLESLLTQQTLLLRIQGPQSLPLGNDSQVMQFDIGYGTFGGGLHYRPNLELIYQLPERSDTVLASSCNTIYKDKVVADKLASGFDANGEIVYGQLAFELNECLAPDRTVFTQACLTLYNTNSLASAKDVRFTVELVELKDVDFKHVKQRQKIEYIGYEVSNEQLKERTAHNFIFDSYSLKELARLHKAQTPLYFIIRATAESQARDALVHWQDCNDVQPAKLHVEYIERRVEALPAPIHLQTQVDNGVVKLTWLNPDNADLVGSFVVRNRFHPPRSPFDGVKLYGGPDQYTFDNFGNADIEKYYAVFSYDHVPNYSQPAVVHYPGRGKVQS
ncbi:M14 family zinc carboxypeptidase [Pseudoalteromonas sp. S16_S37]|uniref:M14 family zinc carboxypeptidase n=1 Tax=Pseudoalteromonas sp. S16_S37 TaxID=2720228 RepID=UPI0016815944|nr:M14 family zinc carboxypeptidase [Pseudoalteromonas sp. S16_S37]MBD1582107.1 peptidase [Pseudoalteromonas sp. S16_S37]